MSRTTPYENGDDALQPLVSFHSSKSLTASHPHHLVERKFADTDDVVNSNLLQEFENSDTVDLGTGLLSDCCQDNHSCFEQKKTEVTVGSCDSKKQSDAQLSVNISTHTNNSDITAISILELEEEVGLMESTLESLHKKSLSLNRKIEEEMTYATLLHHDLQLLNERKLHLKKCTENNMKLVNKCDATLEKCLDKLRHLLGATSKDYQPMTLGSNVMDESDIFDSGNDECDSCAAETTDSKELQSVHDLISNITPSNFRKVEDEELKNTTIPCNINAVLFRYSEIPFITKNFEPHRLRWPPSNLLREIQTEVNALPCFFPFWRTNPLSASLLSSIDSADLLSCMMNISVLENLCKRKELVKSKLLSNDYGWVQESIIWGTPLDIYSHLKYKQLFAGFCRKDETTSEVTIQSDDLVDPNEVLCPYDLSGTCADNRCPYQHLSRIQSHTKIIVPLSSDGMWREIFIRYHSLLDPQIPPALSCYKLLNKNEKNIDMQINDYKNASNKLPFDSMDIYKLRHVPFSNHSSCENCGTKALSSNDIQGHVSKSNASMRLAYDITVMIKSFLPSVNTEETYIDTIGSILLMLHNDLYFPDKQKHNSPSRVIDVLPPHDEIDMNVSDIEENKDFVLLPFVDESPEFHATGLEPVVDEQCEMNKCLFFDGKFWWQKFIDFESSASCNNIIDSIVFSFGLCLNCEYPYRENRKKESNGTLRFYHLHQGTLDPVEVEEIVLFCRAIDFSRVCIHMGQDSLGLSVLHSVCESKRNVSNITLLETAQALMKSISCSRSAYDLFRCHLSLLLISEFYHARYIWLSDKSTFLSEPSIDALLCVLERQAPSKKCNIKKLTQQLISHVPLMNKPSSGVYEDSWEKFARLLQSQLEKLIVVPFIDQKTTINHFSLMLDCAHVGQQLEELFCLAAIKSQSFSPLFHAMDPIWLVMQRFLQMPIAGCKDILKPHVLVILVIGPAIFACMSTLIAHPMIPLKTNQASKRRLPQFDARNRIILSSFENLMIEMLKDIMRCERDSEESGLTEPIVSLIHSLSIALSLSLGSFDKAHQKLDNTLMRRKSSNCQMPSMFALSELLWSQRVHLQMLCPSYDLPLTYEENVPLLPTKIVELHQVIASKIMEYGIILRGVDLPGDRPFVAASHMRVSDQSQWQQVVDFAFAKFSSTKTDEIKESPQISEFCASDMTSETDGFICNILTFPHSLFILGNTLTHLSLPNCTLHGLPFSIGVFLSGLLILDVSHNKIRAFPLVIKDCSTLELIDFSYNQLCTFPGNLALNLPHLQSFLLEGNPAHDIAAGKVKKKQKTLR